MTDVQKPRVFVTRQIPDAGLSRVQSACEAEVWMEKLPPAREELLKRVKGAEGLLTLLTEAVNAELMDAAGPQLKVVSNYAVGFNNIDVAEATARGIRVGNTPGVLTDATADMAMTLLMTAARRIWEAASDVRAGRWQTWEPKGYIGRDLVGKTLGIVGMGRIGSALAKKCRGGWDMNVLYYDQYRNETAERELNARQVDLDVLLAESDFVSVHTNLDESTRGMFNAEAFGKMKRTAVFINTARGPLHDSRDLYIALEEGEIFAAGLDVTDPEPISADDPLLSLLQLHHRAAHRQRHGFQPRRHGRNRRRQPHRRLKRPTVKVLGEPGSRGVELGSIRFLLTDWADYMFCPTDDWVATTFTSSPLANRDIICPRSIVLLRVFDADKCMHPTVIGIIKNHCHDKMSILTQLLRCCRLMEKLDKLLFGQSGNPEQSIFFDLVAGSINRYFVLGHGFGGKVAGVFFLGAVFSVAGFSS